MKNVDGLLGAGALVGLGHLVLVDECVRVVLGHAARTYEGVYCVYVRSSECVVCGGGMGVMPGSRR